MLKLCSDRQAIRWSAVAKCLPEIFCENVKIM